MVIVLKSIKTPPDNVIMLNFSFRKKTAIDNPKNVIMKFEKATCIASNFFRALKNKIIDKKLWNIVSKAIPTKVLVEKEEKLDRTLPS